MTPTTALKSPPLTCDIFCRVVDNFGDIGVAWRLARQISLEHSARVRLIVDDLKSMQALVPIVDADQSRQNVDGVEIVAWRDSTIPSDPAELVIEAFACELPVIFISAMAAMDPPPTWINLEYLSAEPWVAAHHLLPSPHPALPLTKYFYFPGFTENTGGLIREKSLIAELSATPVMEHPRRPRVLVFAYENAPAEALCAAAAEAKLEFAIDIVNGALLDKLQYRRGVSGENGLNRAPVLEFVRVPFVPQSKFDALLRQYDILIVRGEDSFVRAQWAARPFIWHAYPQANAAHLQKLRAFLDLYCEGLAAPAANALRGMWLAWNTPSPNEVGEAWRRFFDQLPALHAHAEKWSKRLTSMPDLASQLLSFHAKNAKIQGFAQP